MYKRSLQLFCGLFVGIFILECVFGIYYEWAFPHVNIYQQDAQLGVRLIPNESQYLKIHTNPRSHLCTNNQGFRGSDFPKPTEDEIIIVGDSQVFGLGVEEDQTFSAQLQHLTNRTVINAGIPTYGPPEYTAIAKELIEQRSPKTLIYTLNMVNDLFEYNSPNSERHKEWDGWAVRTETAPDDVFSFPGRKWLFQKSHLMYSIRRYLRTQQDPNPLLHLPSEGMWDDFLNPNTMINKKDLSSLPEQQQELLTTQSQIEHVRKQLMIQFRIQGETLSDEERQLMNASNASPGDVIDIVQDRYIEEGRSILATTEMINLGVEYRKKFLEELRKTNKKEWLKIDSLVSQNTSLQKKKRRMLKRWMNAQQIPTPLFDTLKEIDTFCTQNGVEFIVLILPMDVQVSPAEWEKYPFSKQDMTSSLTILTDISKDVQKLGHKMINPLEGLRSIQPAGFLDGDIHMDPKGHAKVAQVIQNVMQKPPPPKLPKAGIPDHRTWVPSPSDWIQETSRRIDYIGCKRKLKEEWIHIQCSAPYMEGRYTDIEVIGGHPEQMKYITQTKVTLVMPIQKSETWNIQLHQENHHRVIKIQRTNEEIMRLHISVSQRIEGGKIHTPSASQLELCTCQKKENPSERCPEIIGLIGGLDNTCNQACDTLYARDTELCMQEETCSDKLACATGTPWALPTCPDGSVHAGATGGCFKLCDQHTPCEQGTCSEWMDAMVCF
ncbi:MAG: hypothetical protein CL916_10550 [Deltaproteobacteria bacterium]|nr:hypothetical protein [Deltaproteobacteria bacterium]